METVFWWVKLIILTLLSFFLLIFGIYLLIAAYNLNNPFWFVMTFFSSNLIILLGGVFLVGTYFRIFRAKKDPESVEEDQTE